MGRNDDPGTNAARNIEHEAARGHREDLESPLCRCIDLRVTCKERRRRWRFEDSFKAEGMRATNPDAPWYVEIRGRNGTIYPLGGDMLAVNVEGHAKIPSMLRALGSEVRLIQGNVVFRFPANLLDAVAEVIRPKKKRVGNVAGIEALARYRQSQDRKTALESPKTVEGLSPPTGGSFLTKKTRSRRCRMGRNDDPGISLGNGTALKDSGKALLVKLEEEDDPIWIPHSVIHENSEVYGVSTDTSEGEVVVMKWWAEERGLA